MLMYLQTAEVVRNVTVCPTWNNDMVRKQTPPRTTAVQFNQRLWGDVGLLLVHIIPVPYTVYQNVQTAAKNKSATVTTMIKHTLKVK